MSECSRLPHDNELGRSLSFTSTDLHSSHGESCAPRICAGLQVAFVCTLIVIGALVNSMAVSEVIATLTTIDDVWNDVHLYQKCI